ncbi:MAG TPA: D-alanyl-D-alanine carboxypeptidase, partial [Kofleriaceae bacterium]
MRSQPAAPAVASVGSAAEPEPEPTDLEEVGNGSGAVLTAPADPKARAVWLAEHLAAAISAKTTGAKPLLAKARIGVAVYDLATNTELFSHDPDKGLNLASNTKLLTSVAALATLGGGFRWRTAVYVDDLDDKTGKVAGDLYLRGRG